MAGQEKYFEVMWRIEYAKRWLDVREDTLFSHQFLAETLENTRWRLRLSSNWGPTEKYISLSLQRDHFEDEGPDIIALDYELMFLSGLGRSLRSSRCVKKFAPQTVSHELSVRQVEILKLQKEAFLTDDNLIVCCKMRNNKGSISKEERCTIRSVIGTKRITMRGNIDLSREKQTVNFTPTSPEIHLISFDIDVVKKEKFHRQGIVFERIFNFKTKKVESIKFICVKYDLFYLSETGFNGSCKLFSKESYPDVEFQIVHKYDVKESTLKPWPLQLEIDYFPGVKLESIIYEIKYPEKPACGLEDIKLINPADPASFYLNTPNSLLAPEVEAKTYDTEKDQSIYEDGGLDSSGMDHVFSAKFKRDLVSLYEDRFFCDTKLRTDTETFPAHKCVLSARSPVFKKMFTTDMKEKAGECIDMLDISSDAIRRMLRFLYTESTGNLDMQSVKDLYVVSDKYDIGSLKEHCSWFMKKNLCPSNVCEVLVFANMHQDKDLESSANKYVLNYYDDVFASEEWKLFMRNYGSLAAQVKFLKNMNNK